MTRTILREELATRLARYQMILALWEGGSAAFGRSDKYSDLDLALLYRLGARDEIWRAVDQTFEELGGVDLRWNDPKPFRAGGGKRIFRPRRASDKWLQVEIRIIPDTAKELYIQPERHGKILVIFDRTGRLVPSKFDEDGNRQRARIALHQVLMKWQLSHGWFRKELARGRNGDAFLTHFYTTLTPLLTVLNMLYRLNTWDLGFRYLKEELPKEIVEAVERLCYISQPADLEERFFEADQLFRATVKELEKRGITPIDLIGFDISPIFRDG